ncbi:hypothetical protein LV457_17345 [Mycobacterium sp. MYCO198283]|uniref:hypothetical protein n=1 Tax=Mycobacterium sp. MYCO198283 TaxID=2883505 RepID=UPI001E28BE55|nr:hypothetical protein [Mycobacterium sp. MYCO198283]MCG5434040.1 hypothetical protein [Mycobacterium sp. MYCO198283]
MRPPLIPVLCVAGAAAACSALLAVGGEVPAGAAPASDARGYLDSTARCTAPDVAVLFGSTATARVAICKAPDGDLTYRGVRLRDGAKLVVPATAGTNGTYVAESGGARYTVSRDTLTVSVGGGLIRDEPLVDSHGASAPAAPAPSAPSSAAPPPGPPLPAEVGGSGS